ncbi:MAG: rhomboid family intramembrane serine protease [Candidatus Caenarcaniphilales bacterium]|nr:rhomboid family intramembrane serine protease [Candidatus Caenarcaniphilales bacterium]
MTSINCPNCKTLIHSEVSTCPECGHPQPGFLGYYNLVKSLDGYKFANWILYICGAIYLLSLIVDLKHVNFGLNFGFLGPSSKSLLLFGGGGSIPIFQFGNWWTIFTAPLLHASIFHIGFNCAWVSQLAPVAYKFYGFSKLVIIYILSGAFGAFLTAFAGVYFTGFLKGASFSIGASGCVFGLMGALISCGQQSGSNLLRNTIWQYAIIGFIFGLLMPNIDNWAHFGGFLGGYLLPKIKWLSYKCTETVNHYLLAIGLIIISFLSLLASIYSGLFIWKIFPDLLLN